MVSRHSHRAVDTDREQQSKMTHIDDGSSTTVITLEGKLVKHSACVLQRACEQLLYEHCRVTIDCAELLFVDYPACKSLLKLKEQGVRLVNHPFFIEALLHRMHTDEKTNTAARVNTK